MNEGKKKFRLKKDLFPVGTVIENHGMTKHQMFGSPVDPICEVTVGISKDHTVNLFIGLETILAHPDYFEEIQ